MSTKLYAERDAMELDRAGNFYCRHVHAMTVEDLHSKADIAAELGWRDQQLAEKDKEIAALREDKERLRFLIEATDHDGSTGWQVILRYDNYQDGALIINGSEEIIGEFYGEGAPYEQFIKAIDAARQQGGAK